MSEAVKHVKPQPNPQNFNLWSLQALFVVLPAAKSCPGIFWKKSTKLQLRVGSTVYPGVFSNFHIHWHCLFSTRKLSRKKMDWFHVQQVLKTKTPSWGFYGEKIYFCFSPMDWKGLKRAPKWKVYLLLSYYSFEFVIFMDSTIVNRHFFPAFKGNSYFFQTPFPSKSKLEIHPFFTEKTNMDLSRTFGSWGLMKASIRCWWVLYLSAITLTGSVFFESHSIHVRHIYLHVANQPLNVGRYTSPMDAMGFMAAKNPARCAWWEKWRWGLLINGRSIEILFFLLVG